MKAGKYYILIPILILCLSSCEDEYGFGWQSGSAVSWDLLIRTSDTLIVTYPKSVRSDDGLHVYAPTVRIDYDTILVYNDTILWGSHSINSGDYRNLYTTYQRITHREDVKILYYPFFLGSQHIRYHLDDSTHYPIFDSISQLKLDSAFEKYGYLLPKNKDYLKLELKSL